MDNGPDEPHTFRHRVHTWGRQVRGVGAGPGAGLAGGREQARSLDLAEGEEVSVGVQLGTHLARRKVIYEVKVLNEATSWRPDPAL